MNLEVRHLKMVEAIAVEGGVTRASRRLYVTQSALSHQLREVEGRLGTPLFLRAGRKMILTEAGRRVLESARTVLAELHAVEEEVRLLGRGGVGTLRIATQCNTCYHWLPSLIRQFQVKYPRVEVQVNVEATRDPESALRRGELDLAIVSCIAREKGLWIFPLFRDELMAILPQGHPRASRSYLTAEDFAEEKLLVYMVPLQENLVFQKVLFPAGVVPLKVTQVMLTEAILEMVKAGLGITVLARWVVAPYIKDGLLRAVRITRGGLLRHWSAVAVDRPGLPSYFTDFARLLSAQALPAADHAFGRRHTGPAGAQSSGRVGRTGKTRRSNLN